MRRNKIDEKTFVMIAEELGFPLSEVRRAVCSFFDVVANDARRLPFNDRRRIYTREKFNEYKSAINIPSIGRIGPVYSRYLAWRRNEAKLVLQEPRSRYRSRLSQDEIEHMAEDILSGKAPSPVKKKKGSEMYNRVWLVGQKGKKSARQVIPKKKENVQD